MQRHLRQTNKPIVLSLACSNMNHDHGIDDLKISRSPAIKLHQTWDKVVQNEFE